MRKGRKEDLYNPISAGFAYTVGNVMIKGIPFFTLPIFTRILSTEDFGYYNLYVSYESILSILLGFGLHGTVRVAQPEFKDRFEEYITAIVGLQIVLSIVSDFLIICVFLILHPKTWITSQILILLLTNTLCSQIYNIENAKFAIKGEVNTSIILSFLLSALNVAISLILCVIVIPSQGYLGRIYGTFLASFVVAIIVMIKQTLRANTYKNLYYWKFALKYGAPLVVSSLSMLILLQIDKLMIQHYVGPSAVGIYSMAVAFYAIIDTLIHSFDNAMAPWLFGCLRSRKYSKARKYNNYIYCMFTLFTVVIMTVSPDIIRFLSTPDYWESFFAVPPLLLAGMFHFFYMIPVGVETFYKRTGYIGVTTMSVAIVDIILNYIMIFTVGYIGASYATGLARMLLFFMHLKQSNRIINTQIVDVKIVIGCLLVGVGFSVMVILAKDVILVRYSVLTIMLGVSMYVVWRMNGFNYIRQYAENLRNRRET